MPSLIKIEDKIINGLATRNFELTKHELNKNHVNVLNFGDNYRVMLNKMRKKFRSKFKVKSNIYPPLLILVSGSKLTGKSCLAKFIS